MSLYRTYRPQDFRQVVGQDFVKVSLSNALRLNKLAGAYLFYGSHGTGKTSVARIFAQGLNCLTLQSDGNPCGTCEHCVAARAGSFLDLVEIDGASYTGVDTVRDLIEKARFQPSQGKYKVYVIDEVHMLSKGAFNALLKTIEEPPAHVKFILATTEIDKIPDTILSRALRYDFKKIPDAQIVGRLAEVCAAEKITADPRALELIAHSADGGLRDALTLLEQFSLGGELSVAQVERDLGLTGRPFLEEFFAALRSGNRSVAEAQLATLRDRGVAARAFLEECLLYLRDQIIAQVGRPDFVWWRSAFGATEDRWMIAKDLPLPFLAIETLVYSLLHQAGVHPTPSTPSTPSAPVSSTPTTPKIPSLVSPVSALTSSTPTTLSPVTSSTSLPQESVVISSGIFSAPLDAEVKNPLPIAQNPEKEPVSITPILPVSETPATPSAPVVTTTSPISEVAPTTPQLFDAPALEPVILVATPVTAPPKSKQFFSGGMERPATTARPAPGEEIKPRVPKFIADMPAPKVPTKNVVAPIPKIVSAPKEAVTPFSPQPFSIATWADAAKKEGAKGSVILALKSSAVDISGDQAIVWATNEPNSVILKSATGLLQIAHRAIFGASVTVDVRLRERPTDLASQAAQIFG